MKFLLEIFFVITIFCRLSSSVPAVLRLSTPAPRARGLPVPPCGAVAGVEELPVAAEAANSRRRGRRRRQRTVLQSGAPARKRYVLVSTTTVGAMLELGYD